MWCFGDISSIEKVHTDFMKYILKVKQSTSHIMLYGELGRFPLYLIIRKRTIKFWSNLMLGKVFKLSYRLYSIIYKDNIGNIYEYPWI